MLFPSFFALLLLHCAYAEIIIRHGNTQFAVNKIREGKDFAIPEYRWEYPWQSRHGLKGLSVSPNIIPPIDAPAIAQLIANANAHKTDALKKAGLQAATRALKELKPLSINPNAVWEADFTATNFPGFGLVLDSANSKDTGHSLLTVTTPISKDTIQATLNSKFKKVLPDTVFSRILALGGNPRANVPTTAPGTPATLPGQPNKPVAPPVAPPATLPGQPNKPVTPVVPKPVAPVVPSVPRPGSPAPPTVPRPVSPVSPVLPRPVSPRPVNPKPVPVRRPSGRDEPLRMRRVRRAPA
ncbi:hypothetical protein DL96DRAFT_1589452 [Flagelloscypha sp. PMI_526]|nr:hypothetical protein DL96DRAFT_1589452 [Flagelloscypha sp. PMI_526]